MAVELTEEVKQYLSSVIKLEVKTASAGVEITDLESSPTMGIGDLLMIRKTDQGKDKKIVYGDFLESIGNTAIDGFIAESTEANKIVARSANGVAIDKYYTGMKVSFVSPITSDGAVSLKIGSLPFKDLLVHKTTDTVVLQANDYVEAVYINNSFYQVNSAQYVYTNDYNVVLVDVNAPANYTDVILQSAYGTVKTSYYPGMTVNFICPQDTVGLTRIKIDGLALKDILENSGDYLDAIYTPLYKGQIVRLIYDGQSFIKDRFSNYDPKIEPVVAPDPDKPDEPLVPQQNKVEFKVGNGQKFTNFQEAFSAIIKEYGENGQRLGVQQKVTIIATSSVALYASNKNTLSLNSLDLSWITITATDNKLVFNGAYGGTIWNFIGAPSFSVGLTIDFSNVLATSHVNFMSVTNLKLKDITINAGVSHSIYNLFVHNQQRGKYELTNCILTGGTHASMDVGNTELIFNNVIAKGWGNCGIYLNYGSSLHLVNSDLSKEGVASTNDIALKGGNNTIVQVNSRAKSTMAPNSTNSNTGDKYELRAGTQDVQGA